VDPYPLAISDEVLFDLRKRLALTRWTDTVPGSGWDHGADMATLASLIAYWADGFDWRRQEAALNATLPGYATRVAGGLVHFAHLAGHGPDPLPLVLLHGWPGTFAEMEVLAPLLADPAANGGDAADAFEVVVP
jgi:epoxide hydrolase